MYKMTNKCRFIVLFLVLLGKSSHSSIKTATNDTTTEEYYSNVSTQSTTLIDQAPGSMETTTNPMLASIDLTTDPTSFGQSTPTITSSTTTDHTSGGQTTDFITTNTKQTTKSIATTSSTTEHRPTTTGHIKTTASTTTGATTGDGATTASTTLTDQATGSMATTTSPKTTEFATTHTRTIKQTTESATTSSTTNGGTTGNRHMKTTISTDTGATTRDGATTDSTTKKSTESNDYSKTTIGESIPSKGKQNIGIILGCVSVAALVLACVVFFMVNCQRNRGVQWQRLKEYPVSSANMDVGIADATPPYWEL